MQSMVGDCSKIEKLNNNPYPEILWTGAKGVLLKYRDDNYSTKININLLEG